MDGTQVGIFQEASYVILHCFLQHHDCMHLEVQVISLTFLGSFMNEACKGAFGDEELSAHLVPADLAESHCLTSASGVSWALLSSGIPFGGPYLWQLVSSVMLPPSALSTGSAMTWMTSLPPPSSLPLPFSSSTHPAKGMPPPGALPNPTLSVTFILTILEWKSNQSGIVVGFLEVAHGLLILRVTENLFWNWHIFFRKWQRNGIRLCTSWQGKEFQETVKVGITFFLD